MSTTTKPKLHGLTVTRVGLLGVVTGPDGAFFALAGFTFTNPSSYQEEKAEVAFIMYADEPEEG